MKTAFFGTPEIAVPALLALADTTELVGIVCQPDRPQGRGLREAPCAVKVAARELGIDVHQPVAVRTGTLDRWLRELHVEVVVVMAYGRLLPPAVLAAPRLGCINLHASLLPKYRGAAPIQWALMHGEQETGISVMRMEEGLDTGPVYCARRLAIPPTMNAGELSQELGKLGHLVVRDDLPPVFAGAAPIPQDPSGATYAPLIQPEHRIITWDQAGERVCNQIRALAPRPGAHSFLPGRRLRILAATLDPAPDSPARPPGEVVACSGRTLRVATATAPVTILRAQLDGGRVVEARDLINGRALRLGDRLGISP